MCVVYEAANAFLEWFLPIYFHQLHGVLHLLTHPFEIPFHSKLHHSKPCETNSTLRHLIKTFSINFISVGRFQTLNLSLQEHTWADLHPSDPLLFTPLGKSLNMFTSVTCTKSSQFLIIWEGQCGSMSILITSPFIATVPRLSNIKREKPEWSRELYGPHESRWGWTLWLP